MVDHYPEDTMPEPENPDRTPEYDTERDPDRCKVSQLSRTGSVRALFKHWNIKPKQSQELGGLVLELFEERFATGKYETTH